MLTALFTTTSCATFAPKPRASIQATPDSSTPKDYKTEFTSGYLGWFKGNDGKIYEAMTTNFHKEEPSCPGILQKDQHGNQIFAVLQGDISAWYKAQLP